MRISSKIVNYWYDCKELVDELAPFVTSESYKCERMMWDVEFVIIMGTFALIVWAWARILVRKHFNQ